MKLLVQCEILIKAGSGGCGWRSAEGIVVPIEEVRIREGSKTLELKRLQIGANLLLQCCPFLLTGGGAGRGGIRFVCDQSPDAFEFLQTVFQSQGILTGALGKYGRLRCACALLGP
jgi:hypothetical protein